jgi:hypothetical protein
MTEPTDDTPPLEPPEPDWDAIQLAYETLTDRPTVTARRFGLHHLSIYNRARQKKWIRCPEADEHKLINPTEPGQPSVPAPPRRPSLGQTHRRMVERLYSIIDTKLSQMENRMPGQDDQKSADHEREAKTIGTLISNIEKVQELDGDAGKSRVADAKAAQVKYPAPDVDTERLGRDLAERLIRRARDHVARRVDRAVAPE